MGEPKRRCRMMANFVIALLIVASDIVEAFVHRPRLANKLSHHRSSVPGSCLFAAGGAPQYEKLDAVLQEAKILGEGTVILHIDTLGKSIEYKPGHVLALEIEGDSTTVVETKTTQDMADNGGWMRGPYTVSRATETSFDVLIKVVGEKSKRFASAQPGTALRFGGKFKVPIIEGVKGNDVDRVVFISTGVGAGPCVGAIETALTKKSPFPPIQLVASYRHNAEVLYKDHLDALSKEYPESFVWTPIVTSEVGRVSANEENLKSITLSPFGEACCLGATHYHLIGNGQLVNEFKAGLAKAGVPDERVTTESYFNHQAPVSDEVVGRIAEAVLSASSSTSKKVSPASNS